VTTPDTAIVYIHPGEVKASFAYSVMRTLVYEIGRTQTVPAIIAQYCASGQLVEARNETVAYFLDQTPCTWCLFVDSDMGFAPDTLEQLLGSADPDERPIVGALCFGLKKVTADDDLQATYLRHFPTIYFFHEIDGEVGFKEAIDYPRDALVECHASGAACFLVHRGVLERMRAAYGDNWFTKAKLPNPDGTLRLFSEDLSFFIRARLDMDIPVFVNTGVQTSHDKGAINFTQRTWEAQEALTGDQKDDPLAFETWLQRPA
jgi:glycosyltransferase involved in cell wall biosynthesis